jgi:hypothetical protein
LDFRDGSAEAADTPHTMFIIIISRVSSGYVVQTDLKQQVYPGAG